MSTHPATADMPATGWFRRNRWWLAGAIVLGTLAFWLPYRAAQHEWGRRGYTHPVEARSDGWTTYEGSRWRLVEVLRDDKASNVSGGYLHGDASLLLVVYEVIPGKGIDAESLDRCRGRLSDSRGRVWGGPRLGGTGSAIGDSAIGEASVRARRTLGLDTGCGTRSDGDALATKARPTRPFRFVHMFLVPRALSSQGLHGEIVLDPFETSPPGSYVRFKLGPARRLPAAVPSRN